MFCPFVCPCEAWCLAKRIRYNVCGCRCFDCRLHIYFSSPCNISDKCRVWKARSALAHRRVYGGGPRLRGHSGTHTQMAPLCSPPSVGRASTGYHTTVPSAPPLHTSQPGGGLHLRGFTSSSRFKETKNGEPDGPALRIPHYAHSKHQMNQGAIISPQSTSYYMLTDLRIDFI